MTRINNISPSDLTDQWLISEWRKKAYHITQNGVKQMIDCEHTFNQYCRDHLEKYF